MVRTPVYILVFALVYGLVGAAAALWVASAQPTLGLDLQPDGQDRVLARRCGLPCRGIPENALILAVASALPHVGPAWDADGPAGLQWVSVQAFDILEEPDVLPDDASIRQFRQRQQQLHQVLVGSLVAVAWTPSRTDDGTGPAMRSSVLAARVLAAPQDLGSVFDSAVDVQITFIKPAPRPWGALPFMFWFQVLAGLAGCLIANWIWALRPHDWGVRLFWITGLAFPLVTLPAAVYSTRELALSGGLFQALSALNLLGSLVYGAAFAAIFMAYPQRLVRTAGLIFLPALAAFWWGLSATGILSNPDWAFRYPVLLLMLVAVGCAAWQWHLSRRQAQDMAALRWLMLSVLSGGTLYIVSHVVTSLLGYAPLLPQGYEFGYFLLIYVGVALGLYRYRLFDLDIWAYRILLALGLILTIPLLDAALVLLLGWSGVLALGGAVWVAGLLYWPLRQWLWRRVVQRGGLTLNEILLKLVDVAFEVTDSARQAGWEALLRQLYDPLRLEHAADFPRERTTGTQPAHVLLLEEGQGLQVPSCAALPAVRMWHRNQARRLFSSRDVHVLSEMSRLMDRAEAGRRAAHQAVLQERQRLTQDLHDDMGARMLMLIHKAPTAELADLARKAMADLRSALYALDAEPALLSECLADWRAEAQNRCDAAGVRLQWQTQVLAHDFRVTPRHQTLLERALRECLSNGFKHAAREDLHMSMRFVISSQGLFAFEYRDNGRDFAPDNLKKGLGLTGLERRLKALGGRLILDAVQGGARIRVAVPLVGCHFDPSEWSWVKQRLDTAQEDVRAHRGDRHENLLIGG